MLLVDARATSFSDLGVPALLPFASLMELPSPSRVAPHISAPSTDKLKGMGAIMDPDPDPGVSPLWVMRL